MKPSQLFYTIVEHEEGLRLTSYQDIAGVWTCGYGSTTNADGTPVVEGEVWTLQQAQDNLTHFLNGFINHLNATIPATLTQGQFDSLCDFIYNEGRGAWDTSSLRTVVNKDTNNYAAITIDLLKWDKAHVNGELIVVTDLVERRKHEAYLYQYGVLPDFNT